MKRLGVFLLPYGWDASPMQGYSLALNSPVPIYTPGWREAPWEGSRDGIVVRALTSHQCGPGSIPGPDARSGLSLYWFSSLLWGFFSWFSGFPPSPKTNIQLISAGCKLCCKVTHGPYSSCQRRHCKLSVWPCWAASSLYFATVISRENLFYSI